MADKALIMTLAKVIIAAAWADGRLAPQEVNCLKDLIYRLYQAGRAGEEQFQALDWAVLDMYMESPVDPAERERLVAELEAELRTPRDRQMAIEALQEFIRADGEITAEEQAMVDQVRASLEAVNLGLFGQLARLVQGPMARREAALAGAPNREDHFEDFINNKIFYALRRRLGREEISLNIPEAELRKLSLAGGLMTRVARVDRQVTEGEREMMTRLLQTDWGLSQEAAEFVAEAAIAAVSAEMDYFRLTREFAAVADQPERVRFLDVLFGVAVADGFVSHEEIEEIRLIAQGLVLYHTHFIQAKLKVPRDKRAG